jgi:hypothetical protein
MGDMESRLQKVFHMKPHTQHRNPLFLFYLTGATAVELMGDAEMNQLASGAVSAACCHAYECEGHAVTVSPIRTLAIATCPAQSLEASKPSVRVPADWPSLPCPLPSLTPC